MHEFGIGGLHCGRHRAAAAGTLCLFGPAIYSRSPAILSMAEIHEFPPARL
jgi:hypothetical protein